MQQGRRWLNMGVATVGWILTVGSTVAAERKLVPLVVYVSNQAGTDRALLGKAQAQTDRIFKDAGVQLIWLNLEEEAYRPGCREFNVVVTLLSPGMVRRLSSQGVSERALGSASRAAGRAFIFPDRIREFAANTRTVAAELTGRVMAHEIGHLVLPEGHAHLGIMTAGMETDPTASARFTVPETRSLRALLESRMDVAAEATNCSIP